MTYVARTNVASPIPPKIYFFVERFLEKGLWLLKTGTHFYSCQPLWGGKLFCPPFQPPKSSVFLCCWLLLAAAGATYSREIVLLYVQYCIVP
jgi:hypothetical protein